MLTSFHTAQASGSDWQSIGYALKAQLPQPCHGSLGLLWGTPPLGDMLPSLALLLRSVTKTPRWSNILSHGLAGIPPERQGAVALILPLAMPECVVADVRGNPDQRVRLWQQSDQHLDATAAFQQNPAPAFTLGAYSNLATAPHYQSTIDFSVDLGLICAVTQSCSPISATHVITAARGHSLITLDGAPAQEVLRRDIGGGLGSHSNDWQGRIFIGLPERGHDGDDFRSTSITEFRPDGAIITTESLAVGRRMLFTARSEAGAGHDLRQMVLRCLTRCPAPRAVLYFTTVARRQLWPMLDDECALIRPFIAPQIPLIGIEATAVISGRRVHHDAGLFVLLP